MKNTKSNYMFLEQSSNSIQILNLEISDFLIESHLIIFNLFQNCTLSRLLFSFIKFSQKIKSEAFSFFTCVLYHGCKNKLLNFKYLSIKTSFKYYNTPNQSSKDLFKVITIGNMEND